MWACLHRSFSYLVSSCTGETGGSERERAMKREFAVHPLPCAWGCNGCMYFSGVAGEDLDVWYTSNRTGRSTSNFICHMFSQSYSVHECFGFVPSECEGTQLREAVVALALVEAICRIPSSNDPFRREPRDGPKGDMAYCAR